MTMDPLPQPDELLHLVELRRDEVATQVLPETFKLWADQRSYEQYAADLAEFAATSYGKRHFSFQGVRDERGAVVSCCKRYAREATWAGRRLRAVGIGAVFTMPSERGRGLASLMLGAFLDRERAEGSDLAYLFSDIHPTFYERLGFIALPSRSFTVRASSLARGRAAVAPMADADIAGVRKCYDAGAARRSLSLVRTPVLWDAVRLRERQAEASPGNRYAQPVRLVVREGRIVRAYVKGWRQPRRDAYVLDEMGALDGHEELLPALLSAAIGDLGKVAGWLPPEPERGSLPRGSVKRRSSTVLMVAPLSRTAQMLWQQHANGLLHAAADAFWSTDHI
ncbi:MAG: GNAT family N-acetyltransferase [bacterium]|nr:GNAT family N-acetyltransferase [bacterium]